MKKAILISGLFLITCLAVAAEPVEKSGKSLIQIALLLDASNSMDGLIDQAKSRLWRIVNELALARRKGSRPELQVALYQYGKSSLSAKSGYIQQLVPLTTDLDKVSEALFSLDTNGGDEYCGMAINTADKSLNWSSDHGDYKAIFIAGNEPFTQGSFDFRTACRNAIAHGVIVNTIFCGSEQEGIKGHWKEGAELADGRYMVVDQDQALAHISAPQDKQILELNQKLSSTYVAYGARGKEARERQKKQDANAAGVSEEVAVQRTLTKASRAYKTEKWDVVSAIESGDMDDKELDEVEFEPESPLAVMDAGERKAYIENKAKERRDVRKDLSRLRAEREQWLAGRKQQNGTLDTALLEAVHEQLKKKSFKVEKQEDR